MTYGIVLNLNESEARALDALFGYNDDAFLKAFYKHMGSHYLQPHEKGFRSLSSAVRGQITDQLGIVARARRALNGTTAKEEYLRGLSESLKVVKANAKQRFSRKRIKDKIAELIKKARGF